MPDRALLLSTTAPATSQEATPRGYRTTVQATGSTTSGTGSATILVQVSNDRVQWLTRHTLTLSLSTAEATVGAELDAAWEALRARVDSISGTGAVVTVTMAG